VNMVELTGGGSNAHIVRLSFQRRRISNIWCQAALTYDIASLPFAPAVSAVSNRLGELLSVHYNLLLSQEQQCQRATLGRPSTQMQNALYSIRTTVYRSNIR